MEELVKFYESTLIPHLKSKYGELMVVVTELEATLMLKDGKIAQLEKKIQSLNEIKCKGTLKETPVIEIPKKVGRKKKI